MSGRTTPITNSAQASSPTTATSRRAGDSPSRSVDTPGTECAGADHRQPDDGSEDDDPRASDAAILEGRVSRRSDGRGRSRCPEREAGPGHERSRIRSIFTAAAPNRSSRRSAATAARRSASRANSRRHRRTAALPNRAACASAPKNDGVDPVGQDVGGVEEQQRPDDRAVGVVGPAALEAVELEPANDSSTTPIPTMTGISVRTVGTSASSRPS